MYTKTCRKNYYITPPEFFKSTKEVDRDNADTAADAKCFVKNGQIRKLKASGTRIILPEIEGLGMLRTRFPIAPYHQDGSAIKKELDALKDIVMNPNTFDFMEYVDENGESTKEGGTTDPNKMVDFRTSPSKVTQHIHRFSLLATEVAELKEKGCNGKMMTVETDVVNGHSHPMEVCWNKGGKYFVYKKCDSKAKCFDGHANRIYEESQDE